MSSYSYQPKVFRYKNGCCICKAKSSSSRFTSSQKYEGEFRYCFNLREQRSGKICNACVLIFKRWRKLPDKYSRNWEHVIDSKDKQGRKVRGGKKTEKVETPDKFQFAKKHRYIPKTRFTEDLSDDQGLGEDITSSSASSISGEERLSEGLVSMPSSLAPSPHPNYPSYYDDILYGSQRRKLFKRVRMGTSEYIKSHHKMSDILNTYYWTKAQICCGTIYEGLNKEIAIDTSFRYCKYCLQPFTPPPTRPNSPQQSYKKTEQESVDLGGKKSEDEGVDMYDEESISSSTFYGQQLSQEHKAGMNMLLQFSRALIV